MVESEGCIYTIGGVSGPMQINSIIAYPEVLK